MVQPLLRASSSRMLLRPGTRSHATAQASRSSRTHASSSIISHASTTNSVFASRARPSRNTRLSSHIFPQTRNLSIWPSGASPAPIIGEDGKLVKPSETAATTSSTSAASTTSPTTPTAASEELGIDFQPTSIVASSSTSSSTIPSSAPSPPSIDLQTIPTELAEAAGETRRTLAEYGLGNSTPSGWVQNLLEWVHLSTGLPWYATIGVTILVVRIALFPIMVRGISNNARLARMQPQLMSNIAAIKKAQADGKQLEVTRLQLATRQLFVDNNCGPLRGLVLPLVQMPLFVSFFFALRGMCNAGLPDFSTGGVAWFTDLTVPDPYYALPIASAAATLAVLQVGEYGAPPKQGPMKGVLSAFKLATPAIAYFISSFPAGVLVYWVTHNGFSVLQTLILKIPAFKRWAEIPDPPVQPATEEKGVGFMKAFNDTREAFADLSTGAVEKTQQQQLDKEAKAFKEKTVSDHAARKKATLEALQASTSGQAVDSAPAQMSAEEERKARVAAARKRRDSLKSKRSRI